MERDIRIWHKLTMRAVNESETSGEGENTEPITAG